MRKLILFFLLAFVLPVSAQWGSGGLFRFYASGTAAPLTDSVRVIAGTGIVITKSANQITFASTATAPAGSVDSTAIVNVSVAATDLVNASVLNGKIANGAITVNKFASSVYPAIRGKVGWTSNGTITSDTLTTRIEWGGTANTAQKWFDADNDTVIIQPQNLYPIRLKSSTTQLFGVDTTGFVTKSDMLEFLGGALKETASAGASDTTANYMPMKAFSVGDTATFDIFLSKRFASLDSIVVYAYSNTATSAVVFNCSVRQTAVGDAIAGAFNAAATKTISTGTAGTLRQWSMTSFGSLTASTPSMLRGKIYRTAGGTGGDIFVNRVLIYGVGLR